MEPLEVWAVFWCKGLLLGLALTERGGRENLCDPTLGTRNPITLLPKGCFLSWPMANHHWKMTLDPGVLVL